MQIQVNTDNHINGSEGLSQHVQSIVEDALDRFSTRITRVEVHISDENSSKGGDHDKRCAMEVRVKGLQPLTVSHQAPSVELALQGAADKLEKSLSRTLDRLNNPKTHEIPLQEFEAESDEGDDPKA